MNVKKGPSSIRHWDTNLQPSDYKSPPLTTRSGLLLLPMWIRPHRPFFFYGPGSNPKHAI